MGTSKKPAKTHDYVCIVAIRNLDSKSNKFCKWKTSDLVRFTQFLDQHHRTWCYFNVYSNKGVDKSVRLASFTRYSRPTARKTEYSQGSIF